MKSVLIIGASRGLGLEFIRQYRADSWLTLGTCRSADQDALLAAEGATALRLDVADELGFANLARALDGRSLDLCIYNAGVYGANTDGVIRFPYRNGQTKGQAFRQNGVANRNFHGCDVHHFCPVVSSRAFGPTQPDGV